jgi:YVTN family beta-propeller protein
MKSLKKVRFLSHLGARPSVTLFVLGALGSSLLSGFAYTPKNLVVATVHVGRLPSSLVVSPDSSLVYVGNEDSGSISGIDAATNKVAFTISVSGDPFYLAITPDGTKLYSTVFSSNADLEFSTVTRQLVQSYGTGASPGPQAVSPDGSLVYISNYGGTVTVISNNSLLSPITVGGNPVALVFTPDGSRAYVTNQGLLNNLHYYVSVISTSTNTVSAVIDSSAVPYPLGGVAVSPDGSKVYVTGINSSHNAVLAVIDTATNQITKTILLNKNVRLTASVPALTPDGEFLYIPLSSGQISRYNDMVVMVRTATDKLDGHVIVGMQPVAVAIAPDAKYAYVSNYIDGTVSVIDITPK